jgi:hypothetical protein
MRSIVACFILLLASPASSPCKTPVEIGTSVGLGMFFTGERGGSSEMTISAPSGGFGGLGTIYVTAFPKERFMIEPQTLFHFESQEGTVTFSEMLQLGWLVYPEKKASGYFAVQAGYVTLGGDLHSFAWGAALGKRTKIKETLGLRYEFRYRHYLDDAFDLHELYLGVSLGAIL